MKNVFSLHLLAPFFLKKLELDKLTRKKLWHYLKRNTSFKDMLLTNVIIVVYVIVMLLMLFFSITYACNDNLYVSRHKDIIKVFNLSLWEESFSMIYYLFTGVIFLGYGVLLVFSDYDKKYLIKSYFIVFMSLYEIIRKIELPLFIFLFSVEIYRGWISQATFLLAYLFIRIETRSTLLHFVRMKATLLYSHYSYKELKKFLVS